MQRVQNRRGDKFLLWSLERGCLASPLAIPRCMCPSRYAIHDPLFLCGFLIRCCNRMMHLMSGATIDPRLRVSRFATKTDGDRWRNLAREFTRIGIAIVSGESGKRQMPLR